MGQARRFVLPHGAPFVPRAGLGPRTESRSLKRTRGPSASGSNPVLPLSEAVWVRGFGRLSTPRALAGKKSRSPVGSSPASVRMGTPMPAASLIHERLVAMVAGGLPALDWSPLGLLAASEAGLVGTGTSKQAACPSA